VAHANAHHCDERASALQIAHMRQRGNAADGRRRGQQATGEREGRHQTVAFFLFSSLAASVREHTRHSDCVKRQATQHHVVSDDETGDRPTELEPITRTYRTYMYTTGTTDHARRRQRPQARGAPRRAAHRSSAVGVHDASIMASILA
jgi:hypothetical protein